MRACQDSTVVINILRTPSEQLVQACGSGTLPNLL